MFLRWVKMKKRWMRYSIHGASAYLKIADGCRRTCAFCAIHSSKALLSAGQWRLSLEMLQFSNNKASKKWSWCTGFYRLWIWSGLKGWVNSIAEKFGPGSAWHSWIRVMYTYPGAISDQLIELMSLQPQLIPYLDLPLQHAHPAVLRRMRPPCWADRIYQSIEKMRQAIPDLAIRSTFIVGYPGETEEEFLTLIGFHKRNPIWSYWGVYLLLWTRYTCWSSWWSDLRKRETGASPSS